MLMENNFFYINFNRIMQLKFLLVKLFFRNHLVIITVSAKDKIYSVSILFLQNDANFIHQDKQQPIDLEQWKYYTILYIIILFDCFFLYFIPSGADEGPNLKSFNTALQSLKHKPHFRQRFCLQQRS